MPSFQKVYVVTIPANTTSLTRIIEGIVLSGKLKLLQIDIPDGWDYSTGVQIRIGKHKFPEFDAKGGEDVFTGNNTDISLHPNHELYEDKIEIYGINNDVVAHNCVVTIEVDQ